VQRVDSEVAIQGITREDVQAVLEQTLKNFKESKTRIIYLDASYLYNFDLSDFTYIRKLNLLIRRQPLLAREWHKLLERWYNDQTVRDDFSRIIKPLQISRTFDKVTNEGLESIASSVVGAEQDAYDYRSIGDGVDPVALPSDQTLSNEIDRIDVFASVEGGALTRDGSTIYSIGNHPKSVASADVTECGMHSNSTPENDLMFDHSIFEDAVTHVQNADSVGSTTVIYMCSA
jgi:hypothetical protein